LLNACINEGRSKFNDFEDLMKEVFTLGEGLAKDTNEPVKKLIGDYKIGMKLKKDMPPYTTEELEDEGIPIHSP
jgi:hypothetical protein